MFLDGHAKPEPYTGSGFAFVRGRVRNNVPQESPSSSSGKVLP
jgi:hypothetical protein